MRFLKANIISILRSRGFTPQDLGNEIRICCPFHPYTIGKPDIHPSLDIYHDGTKANCWSCPWSGSWVDIAKFLGVDPGESMHDTGAVEEAFDNMRKEQEKRDRRILLPAEVEPWEGTWRNLSNTFLSPIAYGWFDSRFRVERILFPDYQADGLKWVAGVVHEADRKRLGRHGKWVNAAGMDASTCFFGEDHIKSTGTVIVEGPYDALRLRSYGIPSVALLGTNNWGWAKAERLGLLGIEMVVALTDGDKPGRKCNKEIKHIGKKYFDVRSLKIPWGKDPGNISEKMVLAIKHKLKKLGWRLGNDLA